MDNSFEENAGLHLIIPCEIMDARAAERAYVAQLPGRRHLSHKTFLSLGQ